MPVAQTIVSPAPSVRAPRSRVVIEQARRHGVFVGVLVAGLTFRVLTMTAYPPALFFSDSWEYVTDAFSGHLITISNIRVSGYAAPIRLFTLPARDLVQLVAIQHLAGLVIGTLVYLSLVRARIPRIAAAAAAALILLDGYAITLEQYVMAETLFTLTLLVATLLLAWPSLSGAEGPGARARPWLVVLAGLLLGAAVLQRTAAVFVAPAFLGYVLWGRMGWRVPAGFLVALVIPILGYAAWEDTRYGTFGLTQTAGWTQYGRVAAFADCAGAGIPASERPLCETAAQRRSHLDAPTWYIFSPLSPAGRMFGAFGKTASAEHSNAVLSSFAHRIVLHQPLDYLGAVAGDFLRYFTPGATQFNDAASATSLPASIASEAIDERLRRQFLPATHPQVRSPSSLVRAYRSAIHVPRPILALLALASIAALALRLRARREVLLFSGSALLLVLGTAASAGFGLRYLIPVVPLLALGGVLAVRDLCTRLTSPDAESRHALAKAP